MGPRATGFWIVVGAYLAAGILYLTGLLIWLGYPEARGTLALVAAVIVVFLLLTAVYFARGWLSWVFKEARGRGESLQRALLNAARLALATRFGRGAIGGIALIAVFASAPSFVRALEEGTVGTAILVGIVLMLAGLLNSLAVVAAGSTTPSVSTQGLTKWERVFGTEDEVGPAVDFAVQHAIRIRVRPQAGSQWRFGLKFSRSDEFGAGRYGSGYPLWHLTKNANQDALHASYYDELGRQHENKLITSPYHDGEVTIELSASKTQLTIAVGGNPGYRESLDLRYHRHAQPTAWADGQVVLIRVEVEAL